MKLAEALIEKKDLATRISELQGRYTAAAVIEEGSEPDETPEDLLYSLQSTFTRWEELTVAINVANNRVTIPNSKPNFPDLTMMQSLAHRDSLKSQISHFGSIAGSVRQRNSQRRYYQENGPKMIVAEGVEQKCGGSGDESSLARAVRVQPVRDPVLAQTGHIGRADQIAGVERGVYRLKTQPREDGRRQDETHAGRNAVQN